MLPKAPVVPEPEPAVYPPYSPPFTRKRAEDLMADLREREIIPYGLLPDWAIRKYIKITPLSEGIKRKGVISYGLTSYGYDARLGYKFRLFSGNTGCKLIDPLNQDPHMFQHVEGDYIIIPPNCYALGESMEAYDIPHDVTCICLGKSSYARFGIIVNVTPGEPEWEGKWTIEISNGTPLPVKVYAGMGIMQTIFFRSAPCETTYKEKGGKYQNQTGVTEGKVD